MIRYSLSITEVNPSCRHGLTRRSCRATRSARYWCPLVTLLVLAIALAILIPILKYRPIQAEYLDTSKVALRQSRIHMDINIKFHNPNVYPGTYVHTVVAAHALCRREVCTVPLTMR